MSTTVFPTDLLVCVSYTLFTLCICRYGIQLVNASARGHRVFARQ